MASSVRSFAVEAAQVTADDAVGTFSIQTQSATDTVLLTGAFYGRTERLQTAFAVAARRDGGSITDAKIDGLTYSRDESEPVLLSRRYDRSGPSGMAL